MGSPDFILEATRRSGIFFCLPFDSEPNGLPASPPPGPCPGLVGAHQQDTLEEELLLGGEMLLCECSRCRSFQFKILLVELEVQVKSRASEEKDPKLFFVK